MIPTPITIHYITHPHKKDRYTPALPPADISFASENYVITLTTPSDPPRIFILPSDDSNHTHEIKKDKTYRGKAKLGYCCRKYDEKYATRIKGSSAPRALIKTRNFITVMDFPGLIQRQGID